MRIDILTLFPGMFAGPFGESIVARAVAAGVVEIHVHNLRDWTTDRHRTVDDTPYGGGAGMVMKPEPLFKAIEALRGAGARSGEAEAAAPTASEVLATPAEAQAADPAHGIPAPGGEAAAGAHVVLMTPQGQVYGHAKVEELSRRPHLILVCGHYEGVDERVREHAVDEEISIGDYVLSGGELAAMVVVDSIVRLLPGALGSAESAVDESHAAGLLEYPHYTRPAEFRGWKVPDVLLSGHHGEIDRWRRAQALERTKQRRPDLYRKAVGILSSDSLEKTNG